MRRPIIFLHVPKAAGSSLINMLLARFPPEALYPGHGVLDLRGLPPEEWRRHSLFMGHFDYSELAGAPDPPMVFTMLRDPIERMLSIYRYWRSYSPEQAVRDQLHGPLFAHRVDLAGFFTEAPPGIRFNYDNAMVRQIVGLDHVGPDFGFTAPDEEILALAKHRVDGFVACGIAEEFALSAQHIFAALGLGEPEVRFDNRTSPRAEDAGLSVASLAATDPALLERLHDLTRLDRALYAHARERLFRETGTEAQAVQVA